MKVKVRGWLTSHTQSGMISTEVQLELEFEDGAESTPEPPRGLPAESGDARVTPDPDRPIPLGSGPCERCW